MFKRLFGGFKRRYRAREYERGFDHAAGELLRGTSVAALSNDVEMSRDFGAVTSFDRGMVDAVQRHKELFWPRSSGIKNC